jgi:hypothetical protein
MLLLLLFSCVLIFLLGIRIFLIELLLLFACFSFLIWASSGCLFRVARNPFCSC